MRPTINDLVWNFNLLSAFKMNLWHQRISESDRENELRHVNAD